ncbi:MAG TPA: potassium channel family protein [Cellvibrionaceae bacterium]
MIILHYEFLYQLTAIMRGVGLHHRLRVLLGVTGAVLAHVVEIWVFGCAYYFMNRADGWGQLEGNFDGSLLDCIYFSFTTFTTLGYGDIVAIGNIRFLAGLESLTGLVLITWTASFFFLEMQRYWDQS